MRFQFVRNFPDLHAHIVKGRLELTHDHPFGDRPHLHAESYITHGPAVSRGYQSYTGVNLSWDAYAQDAFYIGRMF